MNVPAVPLAIGIDLGATKIAAVLASAAGEIIASGQAPTEPAAGQNNVLDRIARLANELLAAAGDRQVVGVGIGCPGEVDTPTGIVRNVVNLGWLEVNLAGELRARLVQPLVVRVHIDAHASVLGEHLFGAGRGCLDFVYLGIGSGLGCGIMAQGRLLPGANQVAGMLGHLSLDPDGLECRCGNHGCAETVISGPGLVRLVKKLHRDRGGSTSMDISEDLNPQAVVSAARQGNDLARAALAEMGQRLGGVLAACAALLNPARIVIGGGLGVAAFDLLVEPAWQELTSRTLACSRTNLVITASELQSPSLGASALAWYDQSIQN